jgi:hypothetical protein
LPHVQLTCFVTLLPELEQTCIGEDVPDCKPAICLVAGREEARAKRRTRMREGTNIVILTKFYRT